MFNEQSNGSMDADPMSWEGIIFLMLYLVTIHYLLALKR